MTVQIYNFIQYLHTVTFDSKFWFIKTVFSFSNLYFTKRYVTISASYFTFLLYFSGQLEKQIEFITAAVKDKKLVINSSFCLDYLCKVFCVAKN